MKRITILILAIIMGLSLVACGSSSNDDPASKITVADLEGDWVREDNGWPASIVGDNFVATTIISDEHSRKTTSTIYNVEDGIMSLHWEKGKDDYKIIVENGRAVRLEGMYTYVRVD